jgi:hypothetical protein
MPRQFQKTKSKSGSQSRSAEGESHRRGGESHRRGGESHRRGGESHRRSRSRASASQSASQSVETIAAKQRTKATASIADMEAEIARYENVLAKAPNQALVRAATEKITSLRSALDLEKLALAEISANPAAEFSTMTDEDLTRLIDDSELAAGVESMSVSEAQSRLSTKKNKLALAKAEAKRREKAGKSPSATIEQTKLLITVKITNEFGPQFQALSERPGRENIVEETMRVVSQYNGKNMLAIIRRCTEMGCPAQFITALESYIKSPSTQPEGGRMA